MAVPDTVPYGAVYQHWKTGTHYVLLAIGLDSEDPTNELVVYAVEDDPADVWIRPKSGGGCGFFDDVELPDGSTVPRFRLVAAP